MYRSRVGFLFVVVVAGLLFLTGLLIRTLSQPVLTGHDSQTSSIDHPADIEIVVWASGEPVEHWRVDSLTKAAENLTQFEVKVKGVFYPSGDSRYWPDFVEVAEAQQAPDIVQLGSETFPRWIEAGYIVPFEKCRAEYPEFKDVLDDLWQFSSWQGQIWGVPREFSVAPLYFNKVKLKELGWTDQKIAQLPERIRQGRFTWDDLITTSKTAIDQGVIEPGFGFWHRPTKHELALSTYLGYGGQIYDVDKDKFILVRGALEQWYTFQHRLINEDITLRTLVGPEWHPQPMVRTFFHDAVTHGRVLFWTEGIWHWWRWRKEYVADLGGDDYLYRVIGYALQPTGLRGRPGITNFEEGFYAITSEKASGRKYQEVACALLAKTTTPKINNLHAIEATRLGVLKSQTDDANYRQYPLISETRYMLDYSWSYSWSPSRYDEYQSYIGTLWHFMVKAQKGELTPVEAVAAAIKQLQQELGDNLIIE